jgi:hypothetical protein
MRRIGRWLRDVALSLGAILAIIYLLAAIIMPNG